MTGYLDPMRVYTFIFGLSWIPFVFFVALDEWRGIFITTLLLAGMSFVLGYEVSDRYGDE